MIIADESQRMTTGSYSGTELGESSAALYVGSSSSGRSNYNSQNTNLGSSGYGGNQQAGNNVDYNSQNAFQRNKMNYNLQCEVCKLKGHTKETCYRVVGYPPGHPKFRKKSGGTRMAHAVDCDDPFSTTVQGQCMQNMQHLMEQPAFTKE